MTEAEPTVAERLGRLLDRGLLPAGGPAEAAERLIERLQRPARVALLGLPGSGKSAILNLLAGTVVVPETLRLPTMIVQFGSEPRMLCTVADGHSEIVPGTNLETSLTLSPALITLELDLPALKVISLLEVAAGPLEAEQRRAALWAGKRADILIWCTTSYLPKEQLVWEGMPDAFKDNGFLLLTKVDLLGGREAAAGMHHRVSTRASGEFRQVLSISAKEARAAASEDGVVDRDRFRESGASSVISTIKSRVQMAQRADTDTAELILARHGTAAETPSRPVSEPTPVLPEPDVRESKDVLAAEAAALERVAAAALAAVATTPPHLTVVFTPEPAAAPEVEPEPEPETTQDLKPVVEGAPELEVQSEVLSALQAETTPEAPPSDAAEVVPEGPDSSEDPATTENIPEVIEVAELFPEEYDGFGSDIASSRAGEGLHEQPTEEGDAASEGDDAENAEAVESAQEAEERSARFTARLKQLPQIDDAAKSGLIPLRATWKSRTDATDSMPIEPKPTPNTNPTLRPRPVNPSGEARLVGKLSRSGDGSSEVTGRRSESSAAQTGTASAASADTPKLSTEPERRQTKNTSVFGARPRPTPAADRTEEPLSDDLFPPLPNAIEEQRQPADTQTPTQAGPDGEDQAAEAPADPSTEMLEALAETEEQEPISDEAPQPELTEPPESEPESPAVSEPEPEAPRPSLSDRLGVQNGGPETVRRDVPGVVRVSRLPGSPPTERFTARPAQLRPVAATPMPLPQDLVAPRVTVVRERRVEVASAERRERPRIAPIALPEETAPPTVLKDLPAAEKLYLDQAIDLIVARSKDLANQIDPNEKPPVDLVLQHGLVTTEHILAILSRGGTTQLRRITASFGEVQDLILLMQLEKGHAPADDTLTLLLQLRREMETLRAV